MSRAEATFEIVNELGLHARAAVKLTQAAQRFPACDVTLSRDGQPANAKSVMGVLLLCAAKGAKISVMAEGDGAELAVAAIGELIAARFGEPR